MPAARSGGTSTCSGAPTSGGSLLPPRRRRPSFRRSHRNPSRRSRRPAAARESKLPRVQLRAVLFDVDFTLAKPGPDLGPEGYLRIGARHGLTLDPLCFDAARDAALEHLERHPEHDHDDAIWYTFTERIVLGMGGAQPASY